MKVKEITIHNYKSIAKDCCLRVDDKVTALVGESQSGKTNLLKAIEKFSTGDYQPTEICNFSTAHENKDPDLKMAMITVVVEIAEDDKEEIQNIFPYIMDISQLKITRFYNGQYESEIIGTDLSGARLSDALNQMKKLTKAIESNLNKWQNRYKGMAEEANIDGDIDDAVKKLESFKTNINEPYKKDLISTKPSLLKIYQPLKDSFDKLTDLLSEDETEGEAEQENKVTNDKAKKQEEVDHVWEIITDFEELVAEHDNIIEASQNINNKVVEMLPKFLYVSSEHENLLHGQTNIEEFVQAPEDDKVFSSFRRLIKLSGLDLNNLSDMERLHRKTVLEKASRKVTKELRKFWKQQTVEIKLDLEVNNEGRQFFVTVRTDGRPDGYPEHQGAGFRWYLEFYLSYALAAGKELRDAVLLLDEAGIHLHPYAQRNLVERFREISEHNQIIHATHLPDMLDLENPDSWRVVIHEEGSELGTQVINDAYQPREEKIGYEVVTKALWGSEIVPSIFLGPRNFIVEGASDVIYINTISRILAKDDIDKLFLITEVVLFPAHGLRGYKTLLSFCNRPGFNNVCLFDSDEHGKRKKKQLIADGMLLNSKAVEINDVYSSTSEERDIESIFGFGLLKEASMQVYSSILPVGFAFKSSDLPSKGGLGKRFKDFFESNGVEHYDKTKVAEALKAIIISDGTRLNTDSRERFSMLIDKIKDAFQAKS